MSPENRTTPRTFYLNEQHELARSEKPGGGGIPKYIDIDWATKASAINHSLNRVRKLVDSSPDPSKENHYYILAAPVEEVAKASDNKRVATHGKVFEKTDFAGQHSRIFRRLGIDLLRVADDGSAVVHMKPEVMDQLSTRAQDLPNLGVREQSRWATIERFAVIPSKFRIDADWLDTLRAKHATEAVIEFQPLLSRTEIDALVRALVSILLRNFGESVTGIGADFSGRQWIRGRVTRESLTRIVKDFFSVQSVHSPLVSIAAGSSSKQRSYEPTVLQVDASSLPVIGVIDTGTPANHVILAKYRRGNYVAPNSTLVPRNDHGCFVSSRAVFGEHDYSASPPSATPVGSAAFYDINVGGIGPLDIDDKSVVTPALQAVVSTAPDVRVFNMSFDTEVPLDSLPGPNRSAYLDLIQDLDNFIFQNDVAVIVAAGNSRPGLVPSVNYPRNFEDPRWGLGPWARSFNSLTCGSFVARLSSGGIVTQLGWPSPFCRVGPGLCNSPKPDFSAEGGNSTSTYQPGPQLGVWGLSRDGLWEDRIGTSFAAPILAREVAFAMQRLQLVCERGARPFAVTVKAFLALTASRPVSDDAVAELAARTLGRGAASAHRLNSPSAATGVLIWQGVLEDDKDIARILVPVPYDWLKEADEPYLRLIVASDPPVNAAATDLWATRSVTAKLRLHPDVKAVRPSRLVGSHRSYPLVERLYDLRKHPIESAKANSWLIEVEYEQIAEYYPGMAFPSQQRVAFAAELFDRGQKKVSPQAALQALVTTKSMTRLTVPPASARVAVVLSTTL